MKTALIFAHGWSLDNNYWRNLSPLFKDFSCYFLDSGYYGASILPPTICEDRIIGIGHSLGFLKLIRSTYNFHAMIGIQSFLKFTGYPPQESIRSRNLANMRKYLEISPEKTIEKFHQQLGLMENCSFSKLNLLKLQEDLALLAEDFSNSIITKPLLVITSDDDIVVPAAISRQDFDKFPTVRYAEIKGARHTIGFTEAEATAQIIRKFINDL